MKPVLFRIIIVPYILLTFMIGVICFIIICLLYWIATGEDFLMEKYLPYTSDIYEYLESKTK